MHRIHVIDTHTGGEPTRVVMQGGPELGPGTMAQRRDRFANELDAWRRAVSCEPRGSNCMVGAMLTEPERASSVAGVIFFNNVGYLNMCGHGTIGVAIALAHAGRIEPGRYALDTPVGQVFFEWLGDNQVRITNVPSYRYRANIPVRLPDGQTVYGDIAWGGNWFFLCQAGETPLQLSRLAELHERATTIRQALVDQNITGANGDEIDHVELIGEPLPGEQADARNFVLCPGGEYDRSPCGTGTSAKVACLAGDGRLLPGQIWRQASVIGSLFQASYEAILNDPSINKPDDRPDDQPDQVRVTLVGSAYVNAEAELVLDPNDPFCMGIGDAAYR